MTELNDRRRAMIWGALVADAATMGLHWIYDQSRIRKVAPDTPEFHTPNAADYAGVPAYFAHPTRVSGDQSQYGEQMLVMLRSLAENGSYDRRAYQDTFRAHFGYGGPYVGYIDRPTRDTLDTIAHLERDAVQAARAIDPNIDDETHNIMVTKVAANVTRFSGDALKQEITDAVVQTHDAKYVDYAMQIAAVFLKAQDYPGADDVQLPAISKLPPLIARHHDADDLGDMAADAVRVTNNADVAVNYADFATETLLQTLHTGKIPDMTADDPEVATALSRATTRTGDTTGTVTADIGLSCYLRFGVPSVAHNLMTANSFVDAIRTNIYAGGDNCGRAIFLGAVLGAVHGIDGDKGIPQIWIDTLAQRDDIAAMIDKVVV